MLNFTQRHIPPKHTPTNTFETPGRNSDGVHDNMTQKLPITIPAMVFLAVTAVLVEVLAVIVIMVAAMVSSQ